MASSSKTLWDSVLARRVVFLNERRTAMAQLMTTTFFVIGFLCLVAIAPAARAFPIEVSIAERNAIHSEFDSKLNVVGRQVQGNPDPPVVVRARSAVRLPRCNSTVALDGGGNFRTIQAAIDAVPADRGTRRWVICVSKGVYREKVRVLITKSYVSLWGSPLDPLQVSIEWGDTAGTQVPGGAPGQKMGTYDSYTFAVEAQYFTAAYITFTNTAPRPADGDPNGQAVAVRTSTDYIAFYKCRMIGHQDTLFAHQGVHYYRDCHIRGSIDFIFGNATALFRNCELFADVLSTGFLTAQARAAVGENTGFVFRGGSVTGSGVVYLGRAWGLAARVVFLEVDLGPIIAPAGWDAWGKPTDAVFYGEYKCRGLGSATGGRVKWAFTLTYEQARPFLTQNYIRGPTWLPSAGLPSQASP
eukprot:TRINITY_DN216_c0_g1_i4.p1 TRINITY_DN216_c0_g1~~TRINITY_DN216_c0_g1_i4.p1  ORF type:complete len:414 (+),score=53.81 TRINITY_DN216_c0_g1_i4:301-1542(+)